MLRTHSTTTSARVIREGERARRWRAENRRTGAVNTYITTTSARYCNHTAPRTTPGPGEATMGRDCLVEAGKGFRNASERPGEGFCDFEKNAVNRMYGRCE